MNTISYNTSKDEIMLRFSPLKGKPAIDLREFKVWYSNDGYISGIDIKPFEKVLEEFRKNLNKVRLNGIWKGAKIAEADIKEIRSELLKKHKENW